MNNKVFLFFLFGLVLCSCKSDNSLEHSKNSTHSLDAREYRDASTIDMARELAAASAAITPEESTYKNLDRAQLFQNQSAQSKDMAQACTYALRSAYEYMLAGKNQKAIDGLSTLLERISPIDFPQKTAFVFNIKGNSAIAYFRMGEQENCQNNHNEVSCLLPFENKSFHKLENGSRKCIAEIMELLPIRYDANFVWLLNVAYMTLGEYPDKVPEQYLIPLVPEERIMSINKFKNISSNMGIDDDQLCGGVVLDDFTGNGFMDIIATSWHLEDQMKFYHNNGDGSFTESHQKAGLKGITGGLNVTHGDYNNDGYLDVLILRGAWLSYGKHPNSLLRNNGDGTFTDVTKESNLYSLHSTLTASWADFNNDGWVDILIGNESFPNESASPCELFLNQKNGQFKNVAVEVNADKVGLVKGVAVADIDNDGDQDVFYSVLGGKNYLLRNDKADNAIGFEFVDITSEAKVGEPIFSFPVWFFDYDNDGYEDLYVSSYSVNFFNKIPSEYMKDVMGKPFDAEQPKLYRNLGGGKFEDVTSRMGLDKALFSMGSSFGDFNNDGFLDFYIGTGEPDLKAVIPNRAFLNNNGQKFEEITAQAGLGHVQKGHGISFADLDNDGDEDIYAVMGGAYEGDVFFNAMFENPGHGNNFLKVRLVGKASNRFGFGSRLCLAVESSEGRRKIYRTISSGSSFGSSPAVVHFGYLADEKPVSLEITWPSGLNQKVGSLGTRKIYTIHEGEDSPQADTPVMLELKQSHDMHHHHH